MCLQAVYWKTHKKQNYFICLLTPSEKIVQGPGYLGQCITAQLRFRGFDPKVGQMGFQSMVNSHFFSVASLVMNHGTSFCSFFVKLMYF